MVHSGCDSRRLPQYSLAGKLFTALPVKTPWGYISTVGHWQLYQILDPDVTNAFGKGAVVTGHRYY